MDFEFHPAADQEYLEAANYYDAQIDGLGDRFVDNIEAAISKVRKNPLTWRKLSKHTRRCLAATFPYGIIYVVHQNKIFILAVMHLKRKPGYWKSRLRDVKKGK